MRATAPGTGVLSAFSPGDQAYLAVVTPDGRLKTFDTATGRVAANVPNAGGLGAGPPGALCWAISEPPAPGQPAPLLAVLGCADGAARAYTAATGDLAWAAPAGPPGLGGVVALTCRAGAPGDPILASCAGGRAVSALRPSDGGGGGGASGVVAAGRTQPTALAASPDGSGRLAVGSTGVAVYESTSGRRTARHAGHSGGPVSALAWAPAGGVLVSAGGGDRAAAVWLPSSDASADATRHAPPAAVLPLDGGAVPAALATAPAPGASAFRVAALADSGAAARVWEVALPPAGGGGPPPTVTRLADVAPPGGPRTGAGAPGAARLLAVALAGDGSAVLVASGAPGAPSIERLALPAAAPGPSPVSLVAGGGKLALVSGGGGGATPSFKAAAAAAAAGGARAVAVLEPGAAGGPARAGVAGAAPAKRTRGAGASDAAAAAAAVTTPPPVANGGLARRGGGGESEGEEEEEEGDDGGGPPTTTLGARLAALGVAAGGPVPGAPRPPAGDDDPLAGPAPPRAGTLATLLSQALRAEDAALLERCLMTGGAGAGAGGRGGRRRGGGPPSKSSLTATVAALAPADAGALLRALVSRLRSRASRGRGLAPWLAATLHCHAAYLVAAPGAARPLADLCDALAARSAAAPALASLAGRLDLLLAQAGGGAAAARDAAAAATGRLPGGGGGGGSDDEEGGAADDEYRESEDDDLAAAAELGSEFDDDDDDDDSRGSDSEWSTEDEVDEEDEEDEDGMDF